MNDFETTPIGTLKTLDEKDLEIERLNIDLRDTTLVLEAHRQTHAEQAQRIAELEGAINVALPVARKLECMLLNGAKSKRAYDKMQGQAEYIVEALAKEQDDDT